MLWVFVKKNKTNIHGVFVISLIMADLIWTNIYSICEYNTRVREKTKLNTVEFKIIKSGSQDFLKLCANNTNNSLPVKDSCLRSLNLVK